jgi:tRNA (cmo5U34)-methyltransferase
MSISASLTDEQDIAQEIEGYDRGIRRVLPGYDAMMAAAMDALATHARDVETDGAHVLDLGTGSGRTAAAILARFPQARVTLVDVDAGVLDIARKRLAREATRERDLPRATFHVASFADPLPACDAATASLSLHCVCDPETKRAVYANIKRALPPGGPLIMSDVMVPADAPLRERVMSAWADHLVAGGDTRDEAFARFDAWAKQERYFSVDEELAFIRDAGFRAHDVVFRTGPLAVIVALA